MGLNYRDHAMEAKLEIPKVPVIFPKYNNTIIGPGDHIVLPKNSRKPDYEAEFGFVIGKGGRHIEARELARSRFRIYELQRRERAGFPDCRLAMDHGEKFRYLRSHGPVDCHRR